jgi:hypothetical protein
MNYINEYEFIKAILAGGELNEEKLISTVDRDKIFIKLNKNIHELDSRAIVITNQAIEEEKWSEIPSMDKKSILKVNELIKKSPEKVNISELEAYKKKHPNVPTIYNYLSLIYRVTNQQEKYKNILFETLERFPDYIFGKTALCEYYLNNRDYSKIPVLLNNKFEISQHYPPETKVFHISAVRSFYFVVGKYFARIKKIEKAYKAYFLLYDLDKKHNMTISLRHDIIFYELEHIKKMLEKNSSISKI